MSSLETELTWKTGVEEIARGYANKRAIVLPLRDAERRGLRWKINGFRAQSNLMPDRGMQSFTEVAPSRACAGCFIPLSCHGFPRVLGIFIGRAAHLRS